MMDCGETVRFHFSFPSPETVAALPEVTRVWEHNACDPLGCCTVVLWWNLTDRCMVNMLLPFLSTQHRFELMIVWKIHLDEEGRTTPVLDLLTKVPEQGNIIHSGPFQTEPVPFFAQHLLWIKRKYILQNPAQQRTPTAPAAKLRLWWG